MSYQSKKDQVWEKGAKVRGKDSALYRKDAQGNVMYYHSYGKYSNMGWNIDHSKPQSKGGTDHLNNLNPVNSRLNSSKGDKY